jgi:hypothetical protein
MWTGWIWLRIGASGGFFWAYHSTFGFHKMLRNCWVAEELVVSQEGLSSMELVSCFLCVWHHVDFGNVWVHPCLLGTHFLHLEDWKVYSSFLLARIRVPFPSCLSEYIPCVPPGFLTPRASTLKMDSCHSIRPVSDHNPTCCHNPETQSIWLVSMHTNCWGVLWRVEFIYIRKQVK